MNINDLNKQVLDSRLENVKTIKNNYLPNLDQLYKLIDKQIIRKDKAGETTLVILSDQLTDMIKQCNIDSQIIDQTGLNNWTTILRNHYKTNDFSVLPNTQDLTISWDSIDSDAFDKEIDKIFKD